MKQFMFSLQSWYDMQLSLEKQHKLQIGLIEANINKLKSQLDVLNRRFDKAKEEFSGAVCKGMMAPQIQDYGSFFDTSKKAMAAMLEKIGRLEREKEKWMQKLVQVRREIKLLEKLRETQYSEYLSGVKKEQDKFVDDLVSYKVTVS